MYKDIETEEILTEEQLKEEYERLKADKNTEAETFDMYVESCLRGTLERI